MSPTTQVALLWLVFAATHVGLSSSPIRRRIVGAIGERPFQGLYSVVALAIFVPLVSTYLRWKHAGAWLWEPHRGPVETWVVYIGMGGAFTLLFAGLLRASPASVVPGRSSEVRGVHRITRHPVLMSFALFGLLHLLPNGRTTDLAFFGGFVLFTPLGCWHQDRRKLVELGAEFRSFYGATPFWPFGGRGALRGIRELSPIALALGVGVTVLVRYFHAAWFA